MPSLLTNEDWEVLVSRIATQRVTPFLGAGACYGVLPLGADIAKQWATKYNYPMEDASNLISVAQFLALKYSDSVFPKDLIVEMFKESKTPDFADALEPHRILASFPLPVYITTNYDDFMARALTRHHRNAERVLCQWNKAVKDYVEEHPSIFEKQPDFDPSVPNSVVYHLHGFVPVSESLVLTEDDYMDFLVNFSTRAAQIPPQITRALTRSSLLFIGYRITDWNFRVLLKSLAGPETSSKRLNVAVMPSPKAAESSQEAVEDFLTKFYENMNVRVYWGTAREFLKELQVRWEKSGHAV